MSVETSESLNNQNNDKKKYANIIKIIQLREKYKMKSLNNFNIYNDSIKSISCTNINNKIKQKISKYNCEDLEGENNTFFNSLHKINNISKDILHGSNSFDFSNIHLKKDYFSNSSKNSTKLDEKTNDKSLRKKESTASDKHKYFKCISENNYSFLKNENNYSFLKNEHSYSFLRIKSANSFNSYKDIYDKSYSILNDNLYSFKKDEDIYDHYEKSYTIIHPKYRRFKKKLIKSKTFKIKRKKSNYYMQNIKGANKIYYKKIKSKKKEKKKMYNCDKKKTNSNRDILFNPIFKSSDMYASLSTSKIKYLQERSLSNEEHDREEYIKCIFLSIKRQQKKIDFLEKNAEHLLDLIELLLYRRMKEMHLFKKKICSKDRYKPMFPDIFYFNNNDDLIETMDKKLRFLPKVPAKENLTAYYGPSSLEIFGKYYSSYKYDYKLIKVDVKLYKYCEIFTSSNKICNKTLSFNNSFELLNYFGKKENNLNKNIRKAEKIETIKKGIVPYCSCTPKVNSNKKKVEKTEEKKKEKTYYIKVKEIPNDLIKVLKCKNITIT